MKNIFNYISKQWIKLDKYLITNFKRISVKLLLCCVVARVIDVIFSLMIYAIPLTSEEFLDAVKKFPAFINSIGKALYACLIWPASLYDMDHVGTELFFTEHPLSYILLDWCDFFAQEICNVCLFLCFCLFLYKIIENIKYLMYLVLGLVVTAGLCAYIADFLRRALGGLINKSNELLRIAPDNQLVVTFRGEKYPLSLETLGTFIQYCSDLQRFLEDWSAYLCYGAVVCILFILLYYLIAYLFKTYFPNTTFYGVPATAVAGFIVLSVLCVYYVAFWLSF